MGIHFQTTMAARRPMADSGLASASARRGLGLEPAALETQTLRGTGSTGFGRKLRNRRFSARPLRRCVGRFDEF